jgi:hypothetical protein
MVAPMVAPLGDLGVVMVWFASHRQGILETIDR